MNDIENLITTIIGTRATKKLLKGLQEIGDPFYLLRIYSQEQLAQFVDNRTAEKLYTAIRLGRRIATYPLNLQIVDKPAKAYALLDLTEYPRQEVFWVIYFNHMNHVLKVKVLCVGTATQTLVDVAELVRGAIALNATRLVVAHNHPSNWVEPSEKDINLTKHLIKAGNLMNLEIVDSMVVTPDSFYSMKDKRPDIWNV